MSAGRFPGVVHPIHKYIVNPLVMRGAGRRGNEVAVIHHVGRRSGRAYATPVIPTPVQGGFVIPLAYGEGTDWCQNVLAAGTGVLDLNDEHISFASPRVLTPPEVLQLVPPEFARRFHFFHHHLYVRRTSAA